MAGKRMGPHEQTVMWWGLNRASLDDGAALRSAADEFIERRQAVLTGSSTYATGSDGVVRDAVTYSDIAAQLQAAERIRDLASITVIQAALDAVERGWSYRKVASYLGTNDVTVKRWIELAKEVRDNPGAFASWIG